MMRPSRHELKPMMPALGEIAVGPVQRCSRPTGHEDGSRPCVQVLSQPAPMHRGSSTATIAAPPVGRADRAGSPGAGAPGRSRRLSESGGVGRVAGWRTWADWLACPIRSPSRQLQKTRYCAAEFRSATTYRGTVRRDCASPLGVRGRTGIRSSRLPCVDEVGNHPSSGCMSAVRCAGRHTAPPGSLARSWTRSGVLAGVAPWLLRICSGWPGRASGEICL